VANKTYSLKNQKKLKIFLQKQENDAEQFNNDNNKLSERARADKKRVLRRPK
jgi:hypothetical protein